MRTHAHTSVRIVVISYLPRPALMTRVADNHPICRHADNDDDELKMKAYNNYDNDLARVDDGNRILM